MSDVTDKKENVEVPGVFSANKNSLLYMVLGAFLIGPTIQAVIPPLDEYFVSHEEIVSIENSILELKADVEEIKDAITKSAD